MSRKCFIFAVVFVCSNFKMDFGRADRIPGFWFDSGLDFPPTDSAKKHNVLFGKMFTYLKAGPLNNLIASTSRRTISQPRTGLGKICLNDTEKLLSDMTSGEDEHYAIKFLDADGKLPPGVLQGSWIWMGDYQECNSIESPFNEFTKHSFKGKYYSVALYRNGLPFLQGLPLVIGACLPDSCDKSDARALAEVAFAPLKQYNISVGFVTQDVNPSYDGAAIATFVIAGVIGLLILLGTLLELLGHLDQLPGKGFVVFSSGSKYGAVGSRDTETTGLLADDATVQGEYIVSKQDKVIKFLLCFSFIRNTTKLLNTSTAKGPLACLNGLRVISMWWVIQGHTYLFSTSVLSNPIYAESTLPRRFTFQPILNGTYSVDTFFFLSGLLVAYLVLREITDKGRMSWIYYFIHRYWRLTPLYAFVMLILMSMSEHMISGPLQWMVSDPAHGQMYNISHSCRDYWWSNLLYINNFYPQYGEGQCFGWAWYLANDMQFYFFISPILLILFKFHKIAGVVVSLFLVAACIGIRGFLVSWYGILGFGGPVTKHTDDPWGKEPLYNRPWARMSVYVVGFLTGFILQHVRCKLRIKKAFVLLGWCVAVGTSLAVIYGLYDYHKNLEKPMSLVASGFYNSLSRTAWALALSWVVLACASGYGGPVNWILSWKLWAPLGRLTYAAYLVHPIILVVYQLNLMTPLHFTDLTLVYMFVSNLVFSYLAAYVVSMAVEAPMMAIEKVILNKQT